MSHRTVEELLFHMPTVARRSQNDWASNFARSIIKQSKRRNWRPSSKQTGIMRRLVGELFQEIEDIEVIEG